MLIHDWLKAVKCHSRIKKIRCDNFSAVRTWTFKDWWSSTMSRQGLKDVHWQNNLISTMMEESKERSFTLSYPLLSGWLCKAFRISPINCLCIHTYLFRLFQTNGELLGLIKAWNMALGGPTFPFSCDSHLCAVFPWRNSKLFYAWRTMLLLFFQNSSILRSLDMMHLFLKYKIINNI